MASVKVAADSLEQQRKEYEKAVKNLDQALEQIKKVNSSLGKDTMLEGVREALTKLSASLETRSGVLLLMTKALEQSCGKYTAVQKKAVTKSSQFRAHNRDFYGNPVVVTVGGAGAAAGVSAGAAAMSQSSETRSSAPEMVSDTGSSVHIKSQNTVNTSAQTDPGIQPAVYTQRGASKAIAQVSEHARNVAAPKAPVDGGFLDKKIDVVNVGAAAAGAAIGGMAGAVAGVFAGKSRKKEERNAARPIKQASDETKPRFKGTDQGPKETKQSPKEPKQSTKVKKQEPPTDIEAQLEAARERLRRFNEMEMEEKR